MQFVRFQWITTNDLWTFTESLSNSYSWGETGRKRDRGQNIIALSQTSYASTIYCALHWVKGKFPFQFTANAHIRMPIQCTNEMQYPILLSHN